MQLTAHRHLLICHMDGGVPFVTSAHIVAQGTVGQAHSIQKFFDAVQNSVHNKMFVMADEDVEVQEPKNTLISDYVSIDNFSLDLQKIDRVRASVEHSYSCICCSVEEFYRTYAHVPQADFDFEIVPHDMPELDWNEAQQPFSDNPVFVEVPVIEIDRAGVWHPGVMLTDTIRMDSKSVIVNHSTGSATVSGHRLYVVNVKDNPPAFDYSTLRGFFTSYGIFRSVVLAK